MFRLIQVSIKTLTAVITSLLMLGCGTAEQVHASDEPSDDIESTEEAAMTSRLDGYWDVASFVGIPPHTGPGHEHYGRNSKFLLKSCDGPDCDYELFTLADFEPQLLGKEVYKIPSAYGQYFASFIGQGFTCKYVCAVAGFYDEDDVLHVFALDKRNRQVDTVDCPSTRSLCAKVAIRAVCRVQPNGNCVPITKSNISVVTRDKESFLDFLRDSDTRVGASHFGQAHSGGEH